MSIKGHRRRKLLRGPQRRARRSDGGAASFCPGGLLLPRRSRASQLCAVAAGTGGRARLLSHFSLSRKPLAPLPQEREGLLCSCCRCRRSLLSCADFPDPRFLTLHRPRTWGCLAPPPSVLLGGSAHFPRRELQRLSQPCRGPRDLSALDLERRGVGRPQRQPRPRRLVACVAAGSESVFAGGGRGLGS